MQNVPFLNFIFFFIFYFFFFYSVSIVLFFFRPLKPRKSFFLKPSSLIKSELMKIYMNLKKKKICRLNSSRANGLFFFLVFGFFCYTTA